MPVKAAPPAPAPAAYNWTGWYIGVNAGASFGNFKTDFNVGDISFVFEHTLGRGDGSWIVC
jgi:hypothetical protein